MAQIKAKLMEYGLQFPESSNWTKIFIASLLDINMGSRELGIVRDRQIARLKGLMDEVLFYDAEIRALSKCPTYKEDAAILETIPGVGTITAMRLLLELGDFRRFGSAGAIASYSGLTPSQYSSGDSVRMGRISRCGRPKIRELLIEASWNLIRWDSGMKAIYLDLSKRRDKKRAIVAIGRKLLIIMRAMVLGGTKYQKRPMF